MMDKGQFIKYHVRSRVPFYLVFIFNGLILVLFAFLFEEVADNSLLCLDNFDICERHHGYLGLEQILQNVKSSLSL